MGSKVCGEPKCPVVLVDGSTRCPRHRAEQRRPRDAARNATRPWRYNDVKWRRIRAAFLRANPACVDCGRPAAVPDHDPVDRRDLVAAGDPHPDAWHHLKPRCEPCHNSRTARRARG